MKTQPSRLNLARVIMHLFRAGLVAAAIWLAVIFCLSAAILIAGEGGEPEQADVIIVLGSGLRRNGQPGDALYRRSVWAAQLYAQGYAPQMICTGGTGEGQPRSEAEACREVLMDQGVPAAVITLEDRSGSTHENAIYSRQIMIASGWETAVLVTDSFHMLRADWVFDREGVRHTPSPVPREWVRAHFFRRHFLREILALHWEAAKDLFNLSVTDL
jgi:uncharacterized SAM-binding protein YcdF (DUF218 family)